MTEDSLITELRAEETNPRTHIGDLTQRAWQEIVRLRGELARIRSEREYVVGFNDGCCHSAGVEKATMDALRQCLSDTRHEICLGPIDDTLWHHKSPACTSVDNITMTLGDDWSYDDWVAKHSEKNF